MKIVFNSTKRVLLFWCVMMMLVVPINAKDQNEATLSASLTDDEIVFLEELTVLDPTHNDIDGEIVSVSKLRVNQMISEQFMSSNVEGITPLGGIGPSYLTMYVTVTRINEVGYDKFQLYSYFRWDNTPFFQLTDGIALAWSDDFTLINSSMTLYYEGLAYTGYNNLKAYLSGVNPESGVGYAFPKLYSIPGPGTTLSTSLQFGAIRAQVRKLNSVGSANVVAKYVHSTLAISGPSFTYGLGPSIGVSITGSYDFREVYTHWDY